MFKAKFFLIGFLGILSVLGCSHEEENDDLESLELASLQKPNVEPQERGSLNDQISMRRQTAITRAVDKVSDAVCGINVTQIREYRRSPFSLYDDPFLRFFFPERVPRRAVKSLGSGFLISPNGFILTNEHVVHEAVEIVVVFPDGTTKNAEVVGTDYITDIALLKVDGGDYNYVRLGNSEDIIIGEWVIALGNPFGLFEINAKPTVTVGVVSAVDRDFGKQQNDRVYQDMIQTDAAINQGNSGGPLVNSLGEVIGMNTFIFTGSDYNTGSIGLGFAIPINRVKRVLEDLKEYGKVNRQWTTGTVVENITPLVARYFQLRSSDGVIVTDIERGSPAARAGLEVGDIIIAVNDQKISDRSDIWTIIEDSDLRAGDEIKLRVRRNRRDLTIKFRLEPIE
ncbi:trypsin-like serine protease [candidate division KSB1 bacterium]|nr:trypsin-like serine protease [candidate division KSB1 bacterium]NIU28717.1 trypsin-like serine protease [candidate division KSB1 bacterium]NIU93342.1 trypsin-like serine protease [candidate division KSB1 bacterium]NIV95963.1 trypsin-like serine protease [candidate division KSB1 bacterium]NIW22622.1 trypsin-like serine protease [candidate division KSB1 bacterium]